jgi:hypothetical protein
MPSILDYFASSIRFASPSTRFPDVQGPCWLWLGGKEYGYGLCKVEHKIWRTHRFSFVLANGSIPSGLFVCHKCDIRHCCNSDHLFTGTDEENQLDKWKWSFVVGQQFLSDVSYDQWRVDLFKTLKKDCVPDNVPKRKRRRRVGRRRRRRRLIVAG